LYQLINLLRHNQKQIISVKQNMGYIFLFAALAARRAPMTDDPASSTPAPDLRAKHRARRATRIARRERSFSLLASGYTYNQIAKMVRTSVATVRREIDRALAERRLDEPERFAQVQVTRLIKALRLAEAAVELGELKAVATYLQIIAALDRYHELGRGRPPNRRSTTVAPPLALPVPPKALTFAAPPAGDEPSALDKAPGAAEETQR
jgi:hypothetical protein